MLIPNRKSREFLCINDDVNITVLTIKGNQIRLRVQAPAYISVHRKEIYQ